MMTTICILTATAGRADLPLRDPAFSYERGAYYYDHGDYEAALWWFAEASESTHAVPLLYNLALTHLQLDNCSMARLFLRRYLQRAVEAGLLAKHWDVSDSLAQTYFRLGWRIADCIETWPERRVVVSDGLPEHIGISRWDWGGGMVAPVRGLW